MNAAVLEMIKKSAAVPSMPQVVARFLQIMQDPDFSYDNLTKALSTDPGTVSEVLRLCNSALFGVRHKVVTAKQALTLLGPKRVRSLLLGRYLVDAMNQKSVTNLDMTYFWRRSLASSVVASHLAGAACREFRDEAFIAALLADIGIPILAEVAPERYASILSRFGPNQIPFTDEDEREGTDVTHGEVSAMVLAHWTLPDVVVKAVNLHQSENPGEGDIADVARILNAADRIARILCEIPDEERVGLVCAEAMALADVSMESLIHMLPLIESEIEELADVLRIDVIASKVYSVIAAKIREQLTPAAAG